MSPELIKTSALCVFSLLMVFAGMRDIVSYTIPNWVSIALGLTFIPAASACGAPLSAILVAVGLGAAMLVGGMVMFAFKWIGGGDAKLLAAAVLWLGLPGLAPLLIFTGLAGGVLAVTLLALRSAWVRPLAIAGPRWMERLAAPGGATPYGVAIAVGALAAFPHGLIMATAHGGP